MTDTATQSKMDTHTFPLFPLLPTEIRLKIWSAYTNLHPRIVEVCLLKGDVERPSYEYRNIAHPFYTPTPLPPSLFSINQESRSIAQLTYPLSFPNGPHAAQIRYNPHIDTIFLPAWCFQYQMNDFEKAAEEEKGKVERLAFETLVWYRDCADGRINNYLQVDEYRNLRELVLVQRLPDYTGCGCCHEFEGPETGRVGFREIEERVDEENGEGGGEVEEREIHEDEGGEEEMEGTGTTKRPTMSEDTMKELLAIRERDPGFSIPTVREVDMTRDGVIV